MRLNVLHEKKGVDYKYSCIMYELPSWFSDEIMQWGIRNIKSSKLYNPGDTYGDNMKYGRENHIHITIKWGLHDRKPTNLFKAIKDWGTFPIELGVVSKFDSSPDYDVIKIDVNSDKLHELNSKISDNLTHTDSYPSYNPHITVAYVQKGSCQNLIGNETFFGTKLNIDKVLWSSYDGEKYIIDLIR